MANLSLLVMLLVGALCVVGGTHKRKLKMTDKERRDMKTITEMSSEEMETSKKTEMEKEELLELKRVHDSDDSDESGSAEESAENDGTGIRSIIHYFDTNNIITVIMFYNVQRVRLNCLQLKVLS